MLPIEIDPIASKIQDLTRVFRRKKKIAAVYIFGSMATGRNRQGSDFDLAIVAKKTISGRERLIIEAGLSSRLRRDVNLVVFGQSAPLLQHQILKYGRLICQSFEFLLKRGKSSYRRKPVSSLFNTFWTPAFAGVTT